MPLFYNQASLSYKNTTTNSNIVQGCIMETLSISKTAVTDYYGSGEAITYAVSLVNNGPTTHNGVVLTDDLGAYTHTSGTLTPLDYVANSVKYYMNGELQATPAVSAGPPLTISGITVPANGNALILYATRANAFAPMGLEDSLTNTATARSGGISAPLRDTAAVYPASGPKLSIQKALSPNVVVEGDTVTYTLTIQNSGNRAATAKDNIIIRDNFNPALRITDVRFNGSAWASPANYSYNAVTGEFSSLPGQITVPAASYTRDAATGAWNVTPGASTLVITGII